MAQTAFFKAILKLKIVVLCGGVDYYLLVVHELKKVGNYWFKRYLDSKYFARFHAGLGQPIDDCYQK